MSLIRATATAVPEHEYDQASVRAVVERWLGADAARYGRVLDVFDRGLVRQRRSVLPLEEIFRSRSFEQKNDEYRRGVLDLGERAVRRCLDRAGVRPDEVDFFVSASCTGFMIPSVDALLAHRLGMKPEVARLPITQHGCAGGAVALRQAHEHLLAYPDHKVLVLAVEIASVTLQLDDLTAENLVSTALFGDGAAAALLGPDDGRGGPRILDTHSVLFPDSADLMGFALRDSGLKILLSKRVPATVREHAPPALAAFLARHGLGFGDLRHFLFHPGGRRIIEDFEAVLCGALEHTRAVIERHGNLSSATILFVIDEFLREARPRPDDLGLMVAFGPGFGCESLLFRWEGAAARGPRRAPEADAALA